MGQRHKICQMLSMTSFFKPQRVQSRRAQGANQHTGILFSIQERERDPMPIPI